MFIIEDIIWLDRIVEKLAWNSSVAWSYQLATDDECLHHDVEYLPNGNVLMIAWENKTSVEAIAAGRDSGLLADGELWPDKIIEIDPSDNSIAWEWSWSAPCRTCRFTSNSRTP